MIQKVNDFQWMNNEMIDYCCPMYLKTSVKGCNKRFFLSTNEHKAFGPVPDQANQSRLDIYLINFQPLWDRSQINPNKLFNAQNRHIIA